MPRKLLACSLGFVSALGLLGAVACSDTPRGTQGIDLGDDSDDSGKLTQPDAADAGAPTCVEHPDPTGYCAKLGGVGTIDTHLLVCVAGKQPAFLECNAPDATPDGGSRTFCCSTGVL